MESKCVLHTAYYINGNSWNKQLLVICTLICYKTGWQYNFKKSRQGFAFQEAGVSPFSLWCKRFPGWLPEKWNGQGRSTDWTPVLPDFTPLDFFLWELWNAFTLHELKTRIRCAAESISTQMLQCVDGTGIPTWCVQTYKWSTCWTAQSSKRNTSSCNLMSECSDVESCVIASHISEMVEIICAHPVYITLVLLTTDMDSFLSKRREANKQEVYVRIH